MKLHIYTTLLILAVTLPTAYGKDMEHRSGDNNRCWYETHYGKKSSGENWAYYFCGPPAEKCAGHKHKGHDKLVIKYHGDSFRFNTTPKDTYFCCGGTKDEVGHFVKASTSADFNEASSLLKEDDSKRENGWIAKLIEEKKTVAGGTCKKVIKTDVCGEVHTIDCDTPDECPDGYKSRNGVCAEECQGDTIFESSTSNKCVKCETTTHQGPNKEHTVCIKCDTATQLFDRTQRECINKNDSSIKQYYKDALHDCWQCPNMTFAKCVTQISSTPEQIEDNIKKQCNLKK